ncbi:hypothetical protein M436DRAFT_56675 [Aureobasidium namibiae CBS 147.97]|uniref:glucan endo-1,3-beta-D-glucosidase n=1 Tax=Aureobasidium namibiae CBS 147.97 TaxID=1043004 RepID=A0A074WH07_9PEZI|nr:uncharacterized protein M436DRAFT_56675 [Aureobasidium namibiae CBS 147.97]KEQ69102.1 hypothetical protein M436DRAFT_56675 [Aureobasidium namibiae CBS 147.97]
MKNIIAASAILAASVSGVAADLCSKGSVDDGGNWYCQAVDAITYTGMLGKGSYNKITSMDSNSGACSSTPYGYSGSMSPLDEEVSLHFRGPLKIKQFAFFSPSTDSSDSSKKAKRSAMHRHNHAHEHVHKHKRDENVEKRGVGDMVTAIIDGVAVSWVNEWSGVASTAAPAPAATTSTAAAPAAASTDSSSKSAPSSASSASSGSSGSWGRKAYYNSEAGSADNVVFLNHNGGQGSGVFDYTFGNSLSYSNSKGDAGASSPQVLADTQLASNDEVIIMSDKECDGDCGYVRDGQVAYHGFAGAQKAFFFEFEMPLDGNTDAATNGDMPAIWMLNAQIPRTLQYGKAECSCWTTGCGEFDLFEVLAPGDLRCKSTLHSNIKGGNSDYFKRPVSGSMKAMVLLNGENMHIKVLDNDYQLPTSLDASWISSQCETGLIQNTLNSLFALVA